MDFRDLILARPAIARHLKEDFAAFCRAAWPTLHPGAKLSWTPGHDCICDYLTAVYEGKIRRLIINCPPRYSKSTIATVCFPVWVWLQDPTKDFLCCSYEIDLSENFNLARRRLIESKWFKDLFGEEVQLSTDRAQAQEFSSTAGGVMQAASTNSKAMGRGGDIIVCDDPLSADVAYSDIFRNEVNFWFEHQLPQRLNNPSESAIIVVMQRLHENDPTGFLLGQEESEWQLLKLPLVAEQDETIVFPRSGRVWQRRKGDVLDPKRWSAKTIRERQRNRLVWSSQFQQRPAPLEGNIVRADEIRYFGGRNPQTGEVDPRLPEHFDRKIVSVDCSFKDVRTADYVAVIVVGVVGARRYLLHVTNAHLDLTGTENEIRNCHALFGPVSAVLVEETANGASVVAHLKDQISGLIAVNPEGGKMARLVAAAPEFQAGNWFVERNGPWTHKVVEQLTVFPRAKHDDLADAISQASIWLQANTYELSLVAWFKKKAADVASGIHTERKLIPAPSLPKGAAETREDGRLQMQRKPGPCPACGSTCTVWLPGSLGVVLCNQCGAQGGSPPDNTVVGLNCCGNPLPQEISNVVRCGNCGLQSSANMPRGISRAEFFASRGHGRFGPN